MAGDGVSESEYRTMYEGASPGVKAQMPKPGPTAEEKAEEARKKREEDRLKREAKAASDKAEREAKAAADKAERERKAAEAKTAAEAKATAAAEARKSAAEKVAGERKADVAERQRLALEKEERQRVERGEKEAVRQEEREAKEEARLAAERERKAQFVAGKAAAAGKEIVKGLFAGAAPVARKMVPRGVRTEGYLPEPAKGVGFDPQALRQASYLGVGGLKAMMVPTQEMYRRSPEEGVYVDMVNHGNGATRTEVFERGEAEGVGRARLGKALANLKRYHLISLKPEFSGVNEPYYEVEP